MEALANEFGARVFLIEGCDTIPWEMEVLSWRVLCRRGGAGRSDRFLVLNRLYNGLIIRCLAVVKISFAILGVTSYSGPAQWLIRVLLECSPAPTRV